MEISKRLLVPYSAERMFDLIEAAEHYPAFMPWCASATIVERSDDVVVADIVVAHKGVRFDFRTRNPKRRPQAMSIRLERGPFRRFEGEWRLWPLGGDGCRIEFEMRYDFNSVMARLAGPVFDRITSAMVDAYVARADALYGGQRDAAAPATPTAGGNGLDTLGEGTAPTSTIDASGDAANPTPVPPPAAEPAEHPTNPDPPRSEKP